MHLFEFESSGFYAAETREAAIAAVVKNLGIDPSEAAEDFERDVPDDEVIDATSEDSWEHTAERVEPRPTRDPDSRYYRLALSAAEHAKLAPAHGYCFGGEQ